jgi:hypothetical protein
MTNARVPGADGIGRILVTVVLYRGFERALVGVQP